MQDFHGHSLFAGAEFITASNWTTGNKAIVGRLLSAELVLKIGDFAGLVQAIKLFDPVQSIFGRSVATLDEILKQQNFFGELLLLLTDS